MGGELDAEGLELGQPAAGCGRRCILPHRLPSIFGERLENEEGTVGELHPWLLGFTLFYIFPRRRSGATHRRRFSCRS